MNYYYDIALNFNEENLMYYEWDKSDCIEIYRKVPLFQVSSKTLKDFLNNQIKVTKEFLEQIKNKAKKKNEGSEYIALFADKNGAIALEFDEEGNSITRSFLDLEDEICLLESLYTLKVEKIDYEIVKPINYKKVLRIEEKMKLLINTEVNSLIKNKDFSKLRYFYTEWFNEEPKDNEEMIKRIKNILNLRVSEEEIKIYNLIKLSYNNV